VAASLVLVAESVWVAGPASVAEFVVVGGLVWAAGSAGVVEPAWVVALVAAVAPVSAVDFRREDLALGAGLVSGVESAGVAQLPGAAGLAFRAGRRSGAEFGVAAGLLSLIGSPPAF